MVNVGVDFTKRVSFDVKNPKSILKNIHEDSKQVCQLKERIVKMKNVYENRLKLLDDEYTENEKKLKNDYESKLETTRKKTIQIKNEKDKEKFDYESKLKNHDENFREI